jgi:glycosyltransferase involved in cell wall biosynthesis
VTESLPISVVIAAYQSAPYLEATLASVRAQRLAPREIIVVDDGSTDETAAIGRRCGVHVIQQANSGPSAARNTGILAATCAWIAFLDSDDLWEPDALERLAAAAQAGGDIDLVFSDSVTFHGDRTLPGTDLERSPAYQGVIRSIVAPGIVLCDQTSLIYHFRRSMFILTSTVLARRSALIESGLFDPRLRVAEDWDLFLRLLHHSTACVVEEPLVRYRVHGANISRDGSINCTYYALLRARIEAHPDEYPAGSAEHFAQEAPHYMWRGGIDALREGRFADAVSALQESYRLRPRARVAMAIVFAHLANNHIGRAAYRSASRVWSRRPWKYRPLGDTR